MPVSHFDRVRWPSKLKLAWKTVHRNGQQSLAAQTRKEVESFAAHHESAIRRISQALKQGSFEFDPALGILQTRPGKNPRPIVKSPISTRIVQRSLLNALQENARIRGYSQTPTSFGGIKGRGVVHAIKAVYEAVQNGSRFFLHSDIKDFFTLIPRDRILTLIASEIDDARFNELLRTALTTELENLSGLGEGANRFPLHEIGVAQGCCLSPLMGNILLRDFDAQLNGRGIVCVRYIDDFLILGPNEKKVRAAFRNAQKFLARFSFQVYDPFGVSDKASFGSIESGIEFLGCLLKKDSVAPNQTSRRRLKAAVQKLLAESKAGMRHGDSRTKGKSGFVPTLMHINNILMGWGNQYSFCNDQRAMNALERRIALALEDYLSFYMRQRAQLGREESNQTRLLIDRQRLLGVHLLRDSKQAALLPLRPAV